MGARTSPERAPSGQGAAEAADEVVQAAELLGAGVAKALLGREVLPDELPYVTGPIGLLGSTASYELMKGCDTLFMVGTSFPYSEWLPEEGQAKGVEIDIDPRFIGIRYPMQANLVGDAQETCCGRPLYDYGFLDIAERHLHRVLDVLREEIRAGTPIVGMEPSCLAVFKDELVKMLPHDDDAARLARNAYHFAEFFRAFEIQPPKLNGEEILRGHCHHRATGGMDPEQQLLEQMGLSVDPVTGGCCGLAGSWGFEKGKYDISMDCGEQALLPAVRAAEPGTVIVANGFSCTTQIADADVGRRALHIAQVMKLAREHGRGGYSAGPAEDAVEGNRPRPGAGRRAARIGVALAALVASGRPSPPGVECRDHAP